MKTISVTHIDTGGHGYLSVSKKDFLLVGADPKEISGCSGHTYTRLYLEEDCDAAVFMNKAKENGFVVNVKSSYNERFSITHDYKPELFDYEPKVGDQIDDRKYIVTSVEAKRILIRDTGTQRVYQIRDSNPFQYIQNVRKA